MDRKRTAMAVGACLVAVGVMAANARVPKVVDPIDPADFDAPVANPYFPLDVGQVSIMRGEEAGARFNERIRVTDDTKVIQGVTTIVVVDRLWEDGALAERTSDWYAPDDQGTVWYFGEYTETIEHGKVVDTGGSWEAGVDGAVAGIIMPADPRPTDAYRQEYFKNEAEDQAWITQRFAERTVPFGHLTDVVRSFEWNRLEPQVMVLKFYAPGLGLVSERDIAGSVERLELVDFIPADES